MIIKGEDIDQSILRKLQLTQQEILDEIVRICELHNIKYYLVGGTLLGAVRHKGFIPWDDDLDIAMPRADYDRFIKLCKTELLDEFYLHSTETHDNYWLVFAKVRKKNTLINEHIIRKLDLPKGIYVDIFPLDNASKRNTFFKRMRTKAIKKIYGVIYYKTGLDLPPRPFIKIVLWFTKFLSVKQLSNMAEKLMRMENKKDTEYYVNFGSNYSTIKQTIPKEKYEPAVKLEFEDKLYNVPRDYDFVLRQIYNDYMQLPPEEKRIMQHRPEYVDFGD